MIKPRLKQTDDLSILSSTYSSEWTAFSMRREWINLLFKHFALNLEQDYEIEVDKLIIADEEFFELNCNFISPNARYAFWKLFNKKAEAAEIEFGIRW
ncbi:MAG: hypothetical protein LBE20_06500 [Deltaproteobacteria bacterium]|jgi:hypothetical protein|nr:hypothetical protein [Deltaproteobacteria bacterium]